MAAKTLYLVDTTASGTPYFGTLQDGGSAPAGATYSAGLDSFAFAANSFSQWSRFLGNPDTPSTALVRPQTHGPGQNLGDCFRTTNSYTTSFSADTWTMTFPMRAVTGEGGQQVAIHARVWRSTNQDGSNATEITSGILDGTTTAALLLSTSSNSVITWSAPAFSLTGEYLFVQLACEMVTEATNFFSANIYLGSTAKITNSTKTFYLKDVVAGTSKFATLQDGGVAPSSALISLNLWEPWPGRQGTHEAFYYFATTGGSAWDGATAAVGLPKPMLDGPGFIAGDSFRTDALSGTFDAGNWSFVPQFRAVNGAGAQIKARLRVWRGSAADGSDAVEVTTSTQEGTTTSALSITTDHASTVTWSAPSFSLLNEYLFVQFAIKIITPGSGRADCYMRQGSASAITTTNFTPGNEADVTGLSASTQLGSVSILTDSSPAATGVHATGHVGGVTFDTTSAALPAFQFNAFQETAFQTDTHVYVNGVQGIGNAGEATYAVGYAAPAVSATGEIGDAVYAPGYDGTGVEGTGEVGAPTFEFDMNFGVFGVTATGYVGVVDINVPAFQSSAFQLNAFQTAPVQSSSISIGGVFATGHVGSVVYKAGYDVTGVSATGALGTITVLIGVLVAVTGVHGTGHVGTLTFNWDFSFTLPRGLYELRAMHGRLGTIGLAMDSSPTADSVIATGYVGSVVYESSVSPDGLEASGVLGDIDFLIDSSPAPAGVFAFGGLGTVRFKVEYTIAGVQGAGAVGTPVAKVTPELVTAGLSVAGGGHVGAVGFIIDCNVHPTGLQSAALLHGFTLRVDSDVAVTGLEASGAVGGTVEENLYAVAGVHGTGQVGTTSPTHAIAVRGVTALGEVGAVAIHHDMTVFPAGIFGTGLIGSPEFPHLVVVDRDKMIYTRAPQPGH